MRSQIETQRTHVGRKRLAVQGVMLICTSWPQHDSDRISAWPHQQCNQRVNTSEQYSSYERSLVVADEQYRTVESYELGSPALSVGRSETICAIMKS
jgi:hypothetical protein